MSEPAARSRYSTYKRRLHRIVGLYLLGLVGFLGLMAWAEEAGLSRQWIGPIFLFATIMLCAAIGIYGRTTETEDYYVAGRRVPAMYNGMATAADWMSAASFISLAGGLYLHGFSGSPDQPGGLAYIMGWTGGFCLVGLLIAPHLRRLEIYTLPDYFGLRFGGRWPRLLAAIAAIVVSFTYVVAQIYGVGLIASRLTGVQFEIGIMLGLGGVLLCAFLGGMRAITWTQVAQYLILLLAFLIPVSWLAYKQLGSPLAPLVYGQQLQKITELEQRLIQSPAENEVRAEYLRRARDIDSRLDDVDAALTRQRTGLRERLQWLKAQDADVALVVAASRELSGLPKDAESARETWSRQRLENLERSEPLGGLPLHSQAFAGDPDGTPAEQRLFNNSRLNFLALMFCLMIGTAGMPHLLTRYYTTPSVQETRTSVVWSLFFIGLLYVSAPALAVLIKFEVMNNLVGSRLDALPGWVAQWARVDGSLLSVSDVNGDGLLQFGELKLGGDILMLAMPEIGGLPYVVSGLVAAGGLAAALSTADGLLLTISNALVRDIYSQEVNRQLPPEHRVILSKFTLLAVAMIAAAVAALKPSDILPLVAASFSLSAAAFVPAMLLGIFWSGMNRRGAVAGMLCGFGVTAWYIALHSQYVRRWFKFAQPPDLWFGIHPISAGVFGVAAGFAVAWSVSLLAARSQPAAAAS